MENVPDFSDASKKIFMKIVGIMLPAYTLEGRDNFNIELRRKANGILYLKVTLTYIGEDGQVQNFNDDVDFPDPVVDYVLMAVNSEGDSNLIYGDYFPLFLTQRGGVKILDKGFANKLVLKPIPLKYVIKSMNLVSYKNPLVTVLYTEAGFPIFLMQGFDEEYHGPDFVDVLEVNLPLTWDDLVSRQDLLDKHEIWGLQAYIVNDKGPVKKVEYGYVLDTTGTLYYKGKFIAGRVRDFFYDPDAEEVVVRDINGKEWRKRRHNVEKSVLLDIQMKEERRQAMKRLSRFQ